MVSAGNWHTLRQLLLPFFLLMFKRLGTVDSYGSAVESSYLKLDQSGFIKSLSLELLVVRGIRV